jgi:translation initiation factor 6
MHILISNIQGNPNIGSFGFANDNFCLLGKEVPTTLVKKIEKVLKVPCHRITICGTSLVGAFVAGNNSKVLVPEIVFESELKELDELGIDYTIIKTNLTALGNNILCDDKSALVNPEFSAEQKKRIREALNVSLKPGTIAELPTVGSLATVNKKAIFTSQEISEEEKDYIQNLFKLEINTGTINMGNNFISSGLISNNNGFIIGSTSSGPEMTNIDEGLGFLGEDDDDE